MRAHHTVGGIIPGLSGLGRIRQQVDQAKVEQVSKPYPSIICVSNSCPGFPVMMVTGSQITHPHSHCFWAECFVTAEKLAWVSGLYWITGLHLCVWITHLAILCLIILTNATLYSFFSKVMTSFTFLPKKKSLNGRLLVIHVNWLKLNNQHWISGFPQD